MLPAAPNISVDHWIAACVAVIITFSCLLTYHTVRSALPVKLQATTLATEIEALQKEIVPIETLKQRLEDHARENMHVLPSANGVTVVKRPDSPQNVHPSQLPVQTAQEAIQLMRTEQHHTTPPIKLVRVQNYTPVTTLYVKPSTPQTYQERK
jgi:hypothetical protein